MLVTIPSSIGPKLCQVALGVLLPFTVAGAATVKDHLPGVSSGVTVIKCGAVIDGLAPAPLTERLITIANGRITSIDRDDGHSTSTLNSVDLSDFTCLPGLINTHVHLDGNPEDSVDYGVYARRTPEETLQLILDNAKTTLLSGFTTVRHAGAWFPDRVYQAREIIERGNALGPRILTAGPYLTVPGGGGDLTFPEIPPDRIPVESQQGIARTPMEFAERAEAAIIAGADFLKVIASGAVFSLGTSPGAPEMTQADIASVVAVAKRYGKKSNRPCAQRPVRARCHLGGGRFP